MSERRSEYWTDSTLMKMSMKLKRFCCIFMVFVTWNTDVANAGTLLVDGTTICGNNTAHTSTSCSNGQCTVTVTCLDGKNQTDTFACEGGSISVINGEVRCGDICDEDDCNKQYCERKADGSCALQKCHPFCDGNGGCVKPYEQQPDGSCKFRKCFPFCDGNGGCADPYEKQPDGSCRFKKCFPFC